MNDYYGFAPTEKMLTPKTIAEMLVISERHLTDLRKEDGSFPAPKMLGALPRWHPAVIHHWMAGAALASTSPDTSTTSAPLQIKKTAKGAQRVH